MYNCFSNRLCDELHINRQNFSFDTNDSTHKIYMLPVKIFKEYTIAIDCDAQVEICCGIFGKYQDERDKFMSLPALTYEKSKDCRFNSPFVYKKLKTDLSSTFSETLLNGIVQNEYDLKMFIKVPANNTSTIVVLEGNYENWNDRLLTPAAIQDASGREINSEAKNLIKKTNHAAINFEYIDELIECPKNIYCGPLQLLSLNTGEQIPFSDRLIEFLIGNAITGEESVSDNVARVQKIVRAEVNKNKDADSFKYFIENEGVWDDKIKAIIYEYMSNRTSASGSLYDITGYVDKDAEVTYNYSYKKIVGKDRDGDNMYQNRSISIAQIDLDDNDIMEDL